MKRLLFLVLLLSCQPREGIRTPIGNPSPPPLAEVPKADPPSYPWHRWEQSPLPITAAHFRCKGATTHPIKKVGEIYVADCRGSGGHSLPLIHGEPGVYPILITLLNHVQEEFGRPVRVTCGHRCPTHNAYADPSKRAQTSKHMIGAEVDFYVEGLEYEPEKVVESLIAYYKREGKFGPIQRYEKGDTDVTTPPWYNREVFIKLYRAEEGRDGDNDHPYPYLAIQVRYDRGEEKAVIYTWEGANNSFLRE
ncbi:MAG: D-Ala-D-Ala carboxypeptidase family metallohydrolase [Parachlamydiales bacterium]